jgi:hypothetical protein
MYIIRSRADVQDTCVSDVAVQVAELLRSHQSELLYEVRMNTMCILILRCKRAGRVSNADTAYILLHCRGDMCVV